MRMIKWENKFSVDVSIMDEEHKSFILIINKVVAGVTQNNKHEIISDALNDMIMYARSHFKTEEKYMIKFDYPEYHEHKKEHKDFLITTVGFCQRVMNREYDIIDDLREYLEQWLAEHLQGSDKKYSEYFNKNGIH